MSRYALAILDNPKLEAMWPFQQNLTISEGGIMVHLNPFLCPSKISPLVNNVLRWNKTDSKRSIDISDTSNGNALACKCREESSDRVKKYQFYFVNAVFYLTEEEGNNVANFSNTAYIIEFAFYGSRSILKVKVKRFPFLSLFALVLLSQH